MRILQKMESIDEVKNTSNEVMKLIKNEGLLTGSTLWQADTNESDIDVILPPNSSLDFDDIIYQHNGLYLHEDEENDIPHYFQTDFKSLYVLRNKKIYNLLFMNTMEAYNAWVFATKRMTEKAIARPEFKQRIKNKAQRIKWFEHYKNKHLEII